MQNRGCFEETAEIEELEEFRLLGSSRPETAPDKGVCQDKNPRILHNYG
jgi:prophage maintenance system killer protein